MKERKHIEERIELYLDGRLTNQEIEELWIDILSKPKYLDHLKINLSLRELNKNKTRSVSLLDKKYQPWAIAAAAFFILLLIIFFNTGSNSSLATVTRIELHELESPNIKRSIQDELTGADSLLNEAFNAAVTGEHEKAISLYSIVLNDYDSFDFEVYLNQGILQFNADNYKDAKVSFQSAYDYAAEPSDEQKSQWFLGNTYVKLDSLGKSREYITKVSEWNGPFQNDAREMLHAIGKQ
ncbi:MAG: hypothetical protein WD491_07070 [Balneolales bacterium]